ncbi:hypothetical protein FQN55_003384 [Onygenales sp. PD_40]|nr:hypothetical protein FQN55_003384 [Onygenales sp. PD_40]
MTSPVPLWAAASNTLQPPFCHPTPLDWALIASTLLTVCLSWWLFEIPAIWQHGFLAFFCRVSWQAVRVTSPSYLAYLVLSRKPENARTSVLAESAAFYYSGAMKSSLVEKELVIDADVRIRGLDYVLIAMYEGPTVVAAVLAAYRWSVMEQGFKYRPVTGEWVSACLPPVVVGCVLMAASRMPWRDRRKMWHVHAIGSTVLVLVGAAYALGIYFGSPRTARGLAVESKDMIRVTVYYAVVMVPWPLLPIINKNSGFQLLILLPATMIRAFGIMLGLTDVGKYKFCSGYVKKLQGVFIAFAVTGFLFILVGLAVCTTVCESEKRSDSVEGGGGHIPVPNEDHDHELAEVHPPEGGGGEQGSHSEPSEYVGQVFCFTPTPIVGPTSKLTQGHTADGD